jgi:pimeloyl-ACP methyl ester carboxylesterase
MENSKVLHSVIMKNVIVCLFCIVVPLGFASTGCSQPDYSKTPVLFVHGHGMNADSWNAMMKYLRSAGYPDLYLRNIQLKPNNGANIPAAERQIAPAVERFLNDVNNYLEKHFPQIALKTKVDIVSHSMGALSSRWYTAKLRPDRVRKWISLAGANHGTNVMCRIRSEGATDLCPAFAKNSKESLIQYLLNGKPHVDDIDETPYGLGKDSPGVDSVPPDNTRSILYVSIRISPDEWIKPEDSAVLDGTGGLKIPIPEGIQAIQTSEGNIMVTNRISHDEMLKDGATLELVKIILSITDKHLH